MKKLLISLALCMALPALAEDMKPNKDPVPSPSDIRGSRGEDRPQGQAPEARTPSPSELATERPRVDGDRRTSGMQDPRNESGRSAAGGSYSAPSPSDQASQPMKTY